MARQARLVTNNGTLGPRLRERVHQLERVNKTALAQGANTAEKASRKSFKYLRPANAAPRAGRSSTGGKLMTLVDWKPVGGKVKLDTQTLDRRAPHWIIQEIGTGEKAVMRRGGTTNAQGRPLRGASYVRTVKSQKGRKISASLAFGTGPSGQFTPAGGGRGQQLYRRRDLTGGTTFRARRMTIQKEIVGQHFVRDGAQEGFREYRTTMLAAARRAFAGQKRRP